MKRNFIEIDEAKCNGCGNCVIACAEGALQIIDGKAKVVKESFCDGLGACIGHCPTDALKIVQKDVDAFDEKAVAKNLKSKDIEQNKHDVPCNCPGMAMHDFREDEQIKEKSRDSKDVKSQLEHWPIQLHLVNPDAPYLKNCNLLIAASCTAFSLGNFHKDILKGHSLVIACPKLDRTEGYIEKLINIFSKGDIQSITVARMEVPCCQGLTMMVKDAIKTSGKKIPFLEEIISIKGDIK
ncbi:MAG: 4Fe-4S binding protein [Candidatus Omnitrophica bacterium]|nr:4Fe-4S binding protein [Candidatus Omnitrophota bacterium]